MTPQPDHEARISALEHQMVRLPLIEDRLAQIALDTAAARHLGAAVDRDVADLSSDLAALDLKVDGLDRKVDGLDRKVDGLSHTLEHHRVIVNALGEQTAGGFAQIRGRLDGLAAGQEAMAAMLATLIEREGDGRAG